MLMHPFEGTHPLSIARNQVVLPSGSFLRALPFTVDETQRFRIDALVICASMIGVAYQSMVEIAVSAVSSTNEIESKRAGPVDIRLFQQAWSVIDQIYNLHRLLRGLQFQGDPIDAFLQVTADVHLLRNRMDHLDQRIPNIVASRDGQRGLFGSISYLIEGHLAGNPGVPICVVTQQAEAIRPADELLSFRIPGEIRGPVGNFALTVAGVEFDIDATILSLGPLMSWLNEKFERSIREQVAAASVLHGVQESELLAHFGAGLKVTLPLSIKPSDSGKEPSS